MSAPLAAIALLIALGATDDEVPVVLRTLHDRYGLPPQNPAEAIRQARSVLAEIQAGSET